MTDSEVCDWVDVYLCRLSADTINENPRETHYEIMYWCDAREQQVRAEFPDRASKALPFREVIRRCKDDQQRRTLEIDELMETRCLTEDEYTEQAEILTRNFFHRLRRLKELRDMSP
jgi:hypothetical protein